MEKRIIEKIRKKRAALNISQKELAYRLDLSPRTYCRIENGQTKLKVVVFFAITAELGVDLGEFLGGM